MLDTFNLEEMKLISDLCDEYECDGELKDRYYEMARRIDAAIKKGAVTMEMLPSDEFVSEDDDFPEIKEIPC